jgi:radical SAM superfamily enzyme YgiQ (UPF0313 family)
MKRKNVKIALVNPPLLPGVMWHRLTVPIGLACLAAVVEKRGYAVKIVDCSPLDMDFDEMKLEVVSFEPDIIGITSLTATFSSALQAAHVLKESCPEAFTVLGGPHATIMSVDIINENVDVDIVVRGEGEETLLELADCVAEERKFDQVAGITFRKNGKTIQTPDRPFIQNLDKLPYPAYHLLPLEKYRPAGSFFGKRILPIMSSRGCPFHCSFCVSSEMFGERFRARSPKNVVDELEWLKNEHGAEAFSFYDDTLTLDKERCQKIFEQMQNRRIDLPWDCFTRTDQISKELLIEMKRAGCQFVTFGVESGSQQLLKAMGKGTTVEQNENAIRWAKEAGLLVATSVVVGYPGETVETLKETFDFIHRVRPNAVYLCAATPFPGTALYELVKNLGWKMSEDWNQYNTVDFTFENPSLPNEYMKKMRKEFYDRLYSPLYILRHFNKNNLYSGILVRVALSHYFWRIKSRF